MYHPIDAGMFGFGQFGALFGAGFAVFLLVALIWTLLWKGLALWHAARSGQWVWFIVFLIVNTAGILEIVYLIWFRGDKNSENLFPFGAAPQPVTPATTVVEEVVVVETSSDDSAAA
ncbi:MAG TPA: DUF5652 family protein [Candidatus Paceibacterota bacterium]|nr:DUF5652 family protein [Candidatus Paceibacterota bacterium]